ncbi:anthranilate synthase component I family protein [Sporosarcina sp. Te-1]|uniref:anthranilate synthase component I family protein n=1 Tax=Sporosarcina sp. Te-1 TaxID=2818390 RepID=UPI001A9F3DA5|nr:anthranilate synthase component I family protein [Sporosarcina sp. Te-1]QTD40271.1 anthranilate synthase component I family protein [Sporosarcina sp. Te-1]
METRQLDYETAMMTREAFFYAYKTVAGETERHLLLESGRSGKLCIAGINPLVTLQASEGSLEATWRDGTVESRAGEDPLESIESFLGTFGISGSLPELPEFQGGAIGFISYDYVRRYEALPSVAINDLETPDLHFYLFDQWAVLDMETEQVYFMALPDRGICPMQMKEKWLEAAAKGLEARKFGMQEKAVPTAVPEEIRVSVDAKQFERMVVEVQQYIELGDVEQVNLSVRQSAPLHADPLDMYEALRAINPSPYMASIGSPDFAVVSGSPELLLKKRGDVVSTRPIGGTRPRGKDEAEDRALEAELLSNTKETKEHKMLVDVELDDFSRICAEETVETDEFMVIEKYSHVMHLVSNLRGVVRQDQTNSDVIRGVFPGGSITGAPKVRTMELIEELEPTRRGLYTGSIGWIGFNGDLDLNIVIRTAYIKGGEVFIQAGAGLVSDSIPKAEYIESLNKANALWQAKEMAEADRVKKAMLL